MSVLRAQGLDGECFSSATPLDSIVYFDAVIAFVPTAERGQRVVQLLKRAGFSGCVIVVSRALRNGEAASVLEVGALDCVRAPADFSALGLKIRRELRSRFGSPEAESLTLSSLRRFFGRTDFRILALLATRAGQTVSWEDLAVHGHERLAASRGASYQAIYRIRQTMKNLNLRADVSTVPGEGARLIL